MRIAVISDIHANAVALTAVIDHIKKQQIDKIIFLGDLVMNGPHPKEVLEIMKNISPSIWIKGNTDNWLEEINSDYKPVTEKEHYLYALFRYAKERLDSDDIELILSKPDKQYFTENGLSILCVHGSHRAINEPIGIMTSQEDVEKITNEIDADILLCGHTHLPYFISFNTKKIINVGSVGLAIDGEPGASYGILDISNSISSYSNFKLSYNLQKVVDDTIINGFPYHDTYISKLKLDQKCNN